jgi:hypothetical protein
MLTNPTGSFPSMSVATSDPILTHDMWNMIGGFSPQSGHWKFAKKSLKALGGPSDNTPKVSVNRTCNESPHSAPLLPSMENATARTMARRAQELVPLCQLLFQPDAPRIAA